MNYSKETNHIIILGSILIFFIWYIVSDHYSQLEPFSNNSPDYLEERIDNDEWTFFDKVMYGGLGYGNICLPSHLFRVLSTIIFPPLGIVIKYIKLTDEFPWFDVGDLIMNIGDLIKSLILTSFFYIPGLIYSLNQLKCESMGNTCNKNNNNNNNNNGWFI